MDTATKYDTVADVAADTIDLMTASIVPTTVTVVGLVQTDLQIVLVTTPRNESNDVVVKTASAVITTNMVPLSQQ